MKTINYSNILKLENIISLKKEISKNFEQSYYILNCQDVFAKSKKDLKKSVKVNSHLQSEIDISINEITKKLNEFNNSRELLKNDRKKLLTSLHNAKRTFVEVNGDIFGKFNLNEIETFLTFFQD